MIDSKEREWNESYQNKENFVFYPHEEVIRFISKYIRKRIGLTEFFDQQNYRSTPKVLDFGCGIGRHVKLLSEFNLDSYGFDLSEEAIRIAKLNFESLGLRKLINKVIVSDITSLPYINNEFEFMISHGVLDSMPFEIAKNGLKELHRCLKEGGKIYFDVISSKGHPSNEDIFEEVVERSHEQGTIQSYFTIGRINELIEGVFSIKEITLITHEDMLTNLQNNRYHVVVEKI